jgi:hypothetical protein
MALPSTIGTMLAGTERGVLIEAVYRALKPIAYRINAENIISGIEREASEADQASATALAVLRGIEDAEGRPVKELDDQQASLYVRELSALVDQRLKQDLGYDEEQAQRTVEQFYESVGRGSSL